MPLRMTGLASGLDTESLVQELMKAQRTKSTKIENKITKLEWTQEKWKDLNTKIYSFYTGALSKVKMQGNFNIRKATSSNSNKVEVTSTSAAPVGNHSIKVKAIASAQFVTGVSLSVDKNNRAITSDTKLSDLGFDVTEGTTIKIDTGDKEVSLDIGSSTTIRNFTDALKKAGLNASYDTNQKRFFISSKESGFQNAFSITSNSTEQAKERNAIRDFIGYGNLSASQKETVDKALAAYIAPNNTPESKEASKNTLLNLMKTPDEAGLDSLLLDYATDSGLIIAKTNSLTMLGLSEINKTTDEFGVVNVTASNGVALVKPSDAMVIYNGAELKSTSNTLTANGLTFTIRGITAGLDTPDEADDEVINISVTNDSKAVYDMIKDFVKTYNEMLKEMNDSYHAESAKGYEPLTDDEKKAMTESQIEKWEDRIKNSLLRRDNTLNTVMSSMRTILSKSVKIDGKSFSLASFGIVSPDYIEKGLLHIKGDPEDKLVSSSDDLLMKAINENPEAVMGVFSKLANEMYSSLNNQMKSTSLSSALTVYNDKEIRNNVTNQKEDLKRLEKKFTDMENRYYKQFAEMEKAITRLNSQSNSIYMLLGMNSQQ